MWKWRICGWGLLNHKQTLCVRGRNTWQIVIRTCNRPIVCKRREESSASTYPAVCPSVRPSGNKLACSWTGRRSRRRRSLAGAFKAEQHRAKRQTPRDVARKDARGRRLTPKRKCSTASFALGAPSSGCIWNSPSSTDTNNLRQINGLVAYYSWLMS